MRILIIGGGSIGRRHVLNASTVGEAAVMDLDKDKATSIGNEADIPYFSTMKEAQDWKPDGVIVATPHATHVGIASEVLDWNAQLLIEKPISHSLDGIEDLFNKAEKLGLDIYVVTNMRFHPAVAALKSNLSEIGTPLFARAHYGNYLPNMRPNSDYRELYAANRSQGGGVILDAVHEIDYLSWLFGTAKEVIAHADKISDLDIDVEDYAAMIVTHESGVRSEIHLDYLRQYKRRGCEIVGTEGTLIWQSEGKHPEHCNVRLFSRKTQKWKTLFESEDLDNANPYMVMMEHFVNSINGKTHNLTPARDGVSVLAVALSALESATKKHVINIEVQHS